MRAHTPLFYVGERDFDRKWYCIWFFFWFKWCKRSKNSHTAKSPSSFYSKVYSIFPTCLPLHSSIAAHVQMNKKKCKSNIVTIAVLFTLMMIHMIVCTQHLDLSFFLFYVHISPSLHLTSFASLTYVYYIFSSAVKIHFGKSKWCTSMILSLEEKKKTVVVNCSASTHVSVFVLYAVVFFYLSLSDCL